MWLLLSAPPVHRQAVALVLVLRLHPLSDTDTAILCLLAQFPTLRVARYEAGGASRFVMYILEHVTLLLLACHHATTA